MAARFRDVNFKKNVLHEQRLLNLLRDGPTVVPDSPAEDKETLKNRLLGVVGAAIDEKLATMADGQGLGIVFRLEVILPCRDPEWAEAVKRRDGRRCRGCGSRSRLEAHHVKPVEDYPELMDDLGNGVTLCAQCHAAEHPGKESFILSKYAKADKVKR